MVMTMVMVTPMVMVRVIECVIGFDILSSDFDINKIKKPFKSMENLRGRSQSESRSSARFASRPGSRHPSREGSRDRTRASSRERRIAEMKPVQVQGDNVFLNY